MAEETRVPMTLDRVALTRDPTNIDSLLAGTAVADVKKDPRSAFITFVGGFILDCDADLGEKVSQLVRMV